MLKLFIFNLLVIAVIAVLLWVIKRQVKCERGQNVVLILAAVATVLLHYSMLFYHCFCDTGLDYLKENPNLILPIYPCNLVMWMAVIFGFYRSKSSRLGEFMADYIFWFGLISSLVGMFANVDFIMNPTFADFNITKSVLAHGTLLFNILLLPVFGFVKIDMFRNMKNILFSIVMMLMTGLYCNLLFRALVSDEAAYDVNSMFLIHSPFEGIDFLTYPIIALISIPLYFGLFTVCELIAKKKGERYYARLAQYLKERKK